LSLLVEVVEVVQVMMLLAEVVLVVFAPAQDTQ
jgi:hypothetical protein